MQFGNSEDSLKDCLSDCLGYHMDCFKKKIWGNCLEIEILTPEMLAEIV